MSIVFSLIVPAFNAQKTITATIKKLVGLDFPTFAYEIIVIDDNSSDDTPELLAGLQKKYSNLRCYINNGKGVSAARNYGLKKAQGKYILFVDADDYISKNSLKELQSFFDANYDKTDVVVYSLVYKKSKGIHRTWRHWREKLLKESRIYNIDETYAILTNVNVCIKNDKDFPIYFDETLSMHEDEEFLTRLVLRKRTFGFLKEAEYIYIQSSNNTTSTRLNPYFTFEDSVSMYETLLRENTVNGKADSYIQKVVLNDLNWKLRANLLIRNTKKYRTADLQRIRYLIDQIDPLLILAHPTMDIYHKHFFLSLKTKKSEVIKKRGRLLLSVDDCTMQSIDGSEIFITKVYSDNGLNISGFLKCPLMNYVAPSEVCLYICTKGSFKLVRTDTSYYSYHSQKLKTNNFLSFNLKNINEDFAFYYAFKDEMFRVPFIRCVRGVMKKIDDMYFWEDLHNRLVINGSVAKVNFVPQTIRSRVGFLRRYLRSTFGITSFVNSLCNLFKTKRKNLLYIDRDGVLDNSFEQFSFDIHQGDDFNRYYVYWNKSDKLGLIRKGIDKKYLIKKNSIKHIWLFLNSQMIFTSFVDPNFYLPMSNRFYKFFFLFRYHPKLVYLQHGCLHAKTLHYAREFNYIDSVVVSTRTEEALLKELGWDEEQFIKTGMPKFDRMTKKELCVNKPIKRILYAPSWRSYLATVDSKNKWWLDESKFLSSSFFKGLQYFSSEEFQRFLSENGIKFEIKLHPIFNEGIKNNSTVLSNLNFISEISDVHYDLVITDFSSLIYDFIYQGIPVVYFCPDLQEIEGGLNLYDEITTPMTDGFGPFAEKKEELLSLLEKIIVSPEILMRYRSRYSSLFFEQPVSHREALYNSLFTKN